MEGNHTYEERNNMQIVGSRILPSRKGKRANVRRKNSSIFRPAVHVYKEGVEFINFLEY